MGYDLRWAMYPPSNDDASYFHANVWTWRRLLAEMDRQGMLKEVSEDETGPDRWPDSDTGAGGIPIHKITSNSGWLVTPAEIAWALEHAPKDDPAELVDDGETTVSFVTGHDAELLAREGYDVSPTRDPAVKPAAGHFSPDQDEWRITWFNWLLFMQGAVDYGGFFVR